MTAAAHSERSTDIKETKFADTFVAAADGDVVAGGAVVDTAFARTLDAAVDDGAAEDVVIDVDGGTAGLWAVERVTLSERLGQVGSFA